MLGAAMPAKSGALDDVAGCAGADRGRGATTPVSEKSEPTCRKVNGLAVAAAACLLYSLYRGCCKNTRRGGRTNHAHGRCRGYVCDKNHEGLHQASLLQDCSNEFCAVRLSMAPLWVFAPAQ